MATTQCLACDHVVDADARYCPACGASMDAAIFIDPAAESVGTDEVVQRSRLASIVVPLLVIGLLVGGIAALIASGDDPAEEGADTPAPTPTVEEDPAPSVDSTPTPEVDTGLPAEVVTVVGNGDRWEPLPTSATHLVVAWRRAVGFLDLATGEWTVQDVEDEVLTDGPTASPFTSATIGVYGSGAVIVSTNGAVDAAIVPLEGEVEAQLPISDGFFVGAAKGSAYFLTGDFGRLFVSEVSPDGVTTWPNPLPQRAFPVAVDKDGDLITFGGGGLFAITPDGGRLITRSVPVSWPVNGRLLVESCNQVFECFLSVLDIDTSGIIPTDLSNVGAQLRRDGSLVVSVTEVGDPAVARISQGGRYEIDPDNGLALEPVEVTSDDGFSALITSDTIRILDDQGRDRVVLDLADVRCCPDPSLAMFATLGG